MSGHIETNFAYDNHVLLLGAGCVHRLSRACWSGEVIKAEPPEQVGNYAGDGGSVGPAGRA
jgi:hypothetical protein